MRPSLPRATPAWRRYLRFWRRDVEGDIDAELRFHLDARAEALMAEGVAPEAARARALAELGDPDQVRRGLRAIDQRMERRRGRGEWLASLGQDAAYAARSLRRTPVVAVTIVLTLALGLGVNAAMFSLLDVLYLRPPAGVADAAGVHRVWRQIRVERGPIYWSGFDYPTYLAVRRTLGADARTAIYTAPERARLARGEDAPTAVVTYASASYFPTLGVHAARGRVFAPDEDRLGAPTNVAVVSDAFWHNRLGGGDQVLGRTLNIGNRQYTIVGVMPPAFTGVEIDAADVWLPFAAFGGHGFQRWWEDRRVNGFQLLVRPHAGMALPPLDARITRALHRPELLDSPADTLDLAQLGSIIRARGPGDSQQEVRIAARLGGVALLVLLIAIANVVNLLLARAVRRRREIAVRLALGISRARLLRLLLSESVLLSLAAAAGALAAARWGGTLLRRLLLPDVQWAASPLHWRVLAFSILVALAAGVLAGLVPALQSTAPDLTDALKAGAREGTLRRSRLRGALVAAQAALSVMLLVGAGLFLESLSNVRGLDIGYDASRLVFADVRFDSRDSARDARLAQELDALASRLRGAPGVQQVALATIQPMYGFSFTNYYPDADTLAHRMPLVTFTGVSPEYFQATGLRILRGTGFDARGAPAQAVVINQALADGLWPGENPIGRCMRFEKPDAPCYTIIGIVETARRGYVIEDPAPQYYLPLGRMPVPSYRAGMLVVRASAGAKPLVISEIRHTLRAAFPSGVPVVKEMTDVLEPQYRPWKLGATLFTLFGVLALVVAAIGIYSTISYGVTQRVHEFGVRVALGARTPDVLRHVLGGALRTVGLGIAAGVLLSLASGRLVAALLYGVRPGNPIILISVAALLGMVALAAALAPAWRAAHVDPITALRAD